MKAHSPPLGGKGEALAAVLRPISTTCKLCRKPLFKIRRGLQLASCCSHLRAEIWGCAGARGGVGRVGEP